MEVQNLDLQNIEVHIERIKQEDFAWLYQRIVRHQSFTICASSGFDTMLEHEKRDLHKFMCEHGIPVYREIRKAEMECASRAIRNRARKLNL